MELKNFESRMVHDGKRNNREVLIHCEICGTPKWARWQRVKKGQGRFCSRSCANIDQRQWGKEYVYFYFDKLKDRWIARWRDKDTGETRVQHKSKFVWEQAYGNVPDGYDINHKDGDHKNDSLDNLEMVEGILHKKGVHGSYRKVIHGIVHKQCPRCENYFPEWEYTETYCTACWKSYMREWRKK